MKNTPKMIVIHCTDYPHSSMADQFVACNGWHRDRDFPLSSLGYYIGYHRLITGGANRQARLDTDEGAHCNQRVDGLSVNFQSLGICVGFDGDVEDVPADLYPLLQAQVHAWQAQYGIPDDKVFFHRHFATDKTCPGTRLDDAWKARLLERVIVPVPVKPNACAAQEAQIAELKQQVSWYDRIIQKLFPSK